MTTYNRSKQNWNLWHSLENNTSWLLLCQYQRWLLLSYIGFSRSYSHNSDRPVTNVWTSSLHPLKWLWTINYPTPMHIIKNQHFIEDWPLRSKFSRFIWSIESLTNSPLNATMQCTSTRLIWKPKSLKSFNLNASKELDLSSRYQARLEPFNELDFYARIHNRFLTFSSFFTLDLVCSLCPH